MSFTVVNSANGNGGSTSQPVTISIAAGHTVGCVWYFDDFGAGGSVSNITDSAGNVYALGNSITDGGTHSAGTASSLAIASSITSVTLNTVGAGGGFLGLWVWDLSASGTISLADTKAAFIPSTTTGANAVSTGSMSITSADGLLLAAVVDLSSAGMTVGTGFSADATGQNGSPGEHKAVTASAPATFTCASAGTGAVVAGLAFQVAGAAGATAYNKPRSSGPGISPNRQSMFAARPLSSVLAGTTGVLQGLSLSQSIGLGTLTAVGAMSGLGTAGALTRGTLSASGSLSGLALSLATGLGSVAGSGSLAGLAISLSQPRGTLLGAGALVGLATGQAVALSNLTALTAGSMQGLAVAQSVARAALTGAGALSGLALGFSEGFGQLTGLSAGSLQGLALSTSMARGSATGAGALSGLGLSAVVSRAALASNVSLQGMGLSISVALGTLRGQPILSGGPRYIVARSYLRSFTVSALTDRRFDEIEPGEAWPLTFDFASEFAPGETLVSIVSVAITCIVGTDLAPSGILNGTPALDATSTKVVVPVKPFIAGNDYRIVVATTTTNTVKAPILVGVLPVRL